VSIDGFGESIKEQSTAVAALLFRAAKTLEEAPLEQKGTTIKAQLALKMDKAEVASLLKDAVIPLREAALRQQQANNFKQLGLAMHNHHDSVGMFPPMSTYDKDGKPLLSWRVHLLPYIDQAELYKQFKLDEPWDSAHNKKLIAKMPPLYATPGKASTIEGGTRIQAFVGKGAFFEGKRGLRFADFTDGLSNTFMLVEAEKEVPWTKPEDLTFDPEAKMLPKLGGAFKGGFHALFGDGSVRFIADTLKPETLKLYIQRNDGIVIPNE
jgi:hypothetical protein